MSTNRLHPLLEVPVEEPDGVAFFQGVLVEARRPDECAPVDTWRYRYMKRTLDFCGAAFLLLLFAIPCVIIAVIIALTSPGPIFYREERIGRSGQTFRIWKFRSMYRDATQRSQIAAAKRSGVVLEWRMRKHLADPRITPIGGVLRSWSLDEVPQLLNVLRGEMSLIGPRPIVKSETPFYGNFLRYYLAATPGMSGLWQVSGRSGVDYNKRARLDMHYVEFWSLRLDLWILFQTFPAVLGRVGAR